jgi:acyl carrier protein
MPAETAQRINNSIRIDKSRQIVFLAGTNLSLNDVLRVADGFCEVVLADEAFHKVAKAYQFVVSRLKTNLPLYGVNTGFGKLAHISIPEKDLARERQLPKRLAERELLPSTLLDDLGADSLGQLNLLSELEERIDRTFSESALSGINTLEDLANMMSELSNG